MYRDRRIRYLRNLTIVVLHSENVVVGHLIHGISLRIGDVITGCLPIKIRVDGSSSS